MKIFISHQWIMKVFEKKLLMLQKNGTFSNIPSRCIKDVSDVCRSVLPNIWNEKILLNKHFLENLKLANVTAIFKEKDKLLLKITDQLAFYQQFLRYSNE